jgi:predicted dehydrogenase
MSGILKFADRRVGAFDCGFTVSFRGSTEIAGTKGAVRIPQIWLPPLTAIFEIVREDQPIVIVAVKCESQIVRMLEDFAHVVFEGRDAQPSPEEAVRMLRVLDALATSAREGKEVGVQ